MLEQGGVLAATSGSSPGAAFRKLAAVEVGRFLEDGTWQHQEDIGRGVEVLGDTERSVQTGQVRWYATGVTVAGVLLIALFLIIGGAF